MVVARRCLECATRLHRKALKNFVAPLESVRKIKRKVLQNVFRCLGELNVTYQSVETSKCLGRNSEIFLTLIMLWGPSREVDRCPWQGYQTLAAQLSPCLTGEKWECVIRDSVISQRCRADLVERISRDGEIEAVVEFPVRKMWTDRPNARFICLGATLQCGNVQHFVALLTRISCGIDSRRSFEVRHRNRFGFGV